MISFSNGSWTIFGFFKIRESIIISAYNYILLSTCVCEHIFVSPNLSNLLFIKKKKKCEHLTRSSIFLYNIIHRRTRIIICSFVKDTSHSDIESNLNKSTLFFSKIRCQKMKCAYSIIIHYVTRSLRISGVLFRYSNRIEKKYVDCFNESSTASRTTKLFLCSEYFFEFRIWDFSEVSCLVFNFFFCIK